jgi:hypothetical protein
LDQKNGVARSRIVHVRHRGPSQRRQVGTDRRARLANAPQELPSRMGSPPATLPPGRLQPRPRRCARRAGPGRRRAARALKGIHGAGLRLVTQSEIGRIWLTGA